MLAWGWMLLCRLFTVLSSPTLKAPAAPPIPTVRSRLISFAHFLCGGIGAPLFEEEGASGEGVLGSL